jgi:Fur family peroxide stress response transcriptional regulator
MDITEIINRIADKGLKVTPQRIAILEAIMKLKNHPTADNIIDYIRKNHPNIATGTVYKVLEALTENELIRKVKTDSDVMRYDAFLENHHHLYCMESDRIEDYKDEELSKLLEDYFRRRNIPGFQIKDIKLQIIGKFLKDVQNQL